MIKATMGGKRKDPYNVEEWPLFGKAVEKTYWHGHKQITRVCIDLGSRRHIVPDPAVFGEDPVKTDAERTSNGVRGGTPEQIMQRRLDNEARIVRFLQDLGMAATVEEVAEGCDLMRRNAAEILRTSVQFERADSGTNTQKSYWKILGDQLKVDGTPRKRHWKVGESAQRIMDYMRENGPCLIGDLVRDLDMNRQNLQKMLTGRYSHIFEVVGEKKPPHGGKPMKIYYLKDPE